MEKVNKWTYDEMLAGIKKCKGYEEYWNSYACNAMSHEAVDDASEYFKFLSMYIPYECISVFPMADSGHISHMPKNGKSSMEINIESNDRNKVLEIEFNKNEVEV